MLQWPRYQHISAVWLFVARYPITVLMVGKDFVAANKWLHYRQAEMIFRPTLVSSALANGPRKLERPFGKPVFLFFGTLYIPVVNLIDGSRCLPRRKKKAKPWQCACAVFSVGQLS